MSVNTDCDVAIVGAGLSGLVAARNLRRAGLSVAVLEARERVGGRTLNADLGGGEVVEVGGQFAGPGQDSIVALAREYGIDTFPTHDEGRFVYELNGRARRRPSGLPPADPATLASFAIACSRLDRLAAGVNIDAPWTSRNARALDATTLAGWMLHNVRGARARALLTLGMRNALSAEPEDLSLLHALVFMRASGDCRYLTATTGGAQQERFVGGSQAIALRVAEEVQDAIQLESAVRRIEQHDDGVVLTTDGTHLQARRAIVAVPPMLAARIDYSPAMPAPREQLLARMPQGTTLKFLTVYDEPFWRAEGLSGQAAGDRGPVSCTFDNSPPGGRPGILLSFVLGRDARVLLDLAPAERERRVLENLARWFGPRAGRPERVIVGSWSEEIWTRGCYTSHLVPGAWTSFGHWLRTPHGRVHWAGTETATRWMGFMDGAVLAGERAAREVAAELAGERGAPAAVGSAA